MDCVCQARREKLLPVSRYSPHQRPVHPRQDQGCVLARVSVPCRHNTRDLIMNFLAELTAKLEWFLEEQPLYWDEAENEKITGKCLRFHPRFPECNPALDEDILWDLLELFASTRTPGAYSLLSCSCGIDEHAGIEKQIFVSYPSPDSI